MPRYDFACDKCEIFWEESILFSEFDEKTKKLKCPSCKSKKKVRQYLEGKDVYGMVYQEPKTLGHQAERNTARMSKYELESKIEQDKVHQLAERKKKYQPWYGSMDKNVRKKIQNASGETKDKMIKKYVSKGEV